MNGIPALYTFTPEDAAEVRSRENNNTPVSADMVVKLRQRMKLKPWRGRTVPLKRVKGRVVCKREEATD